MRYNRLSKTYGLLLFRLFLAALVIVSAMAFSVRVLAEEEQSETAEKLTMQPPHLIQTVTEQDIYEGMLGLGFLESPVLETADCRKAFENVKNCVVRINMGNAYGSGLVWQMTADGVVIATNAHVLAYWDDAESYVFFGQGYYADAAVMGTSGNYDVGFLSVPKDQFTYEELETLYYVSADESVYGSLQPGDSLFCVGAGHEVGELEFHEGTVGDIWKYIDSFENDMLYGHGFAKAGMSGGGTFDGYGHLIGMICGGTEQNETASVPLPSVMAAYKEIMDD